MSVAIFGYSVNWMYTGFELYYMKSSCCRSFFAAKILPNPKLKNERKIFIRGLSKQYDFA